MELVSITTYEKTMVLGGWTRMIGELFGCILLLLIKESKKVLRRNCKCLVVGYLQFL